MRYDTYMNQCLIMFDHASFFCATLLAIVLNWVLFFLALSKASNFLKLCIFFCVVLKAFSQWRLRFIFVAWKGLYFAKLCEFFFGVESGFLINYAIIFVMAKSLSLTNFVNFFYCVECIMEICWFHCHSPILLLLLHIFFIYIVFFSLLSLPLLIFFCCLSLCIFINPLLIGFFSTQFWIFTWLVDFRFFFMRVLAMVFSNHFCTSQNKLRNLLLHH